MSVKIALAGNPNVGKSTLFNKLTGMHQHTGNWPGKTVSNAVGTHIHNGQEYTIVDLPGTYSLNAHSTEEVISRDFLSSGEADAVIIVCDATCMERNLILVLQILDITTKAIVCVNLMDEARKKKIKINLNLLQEKLGVPVIATTARGGKGMEELMNAVETVIASKEEKVPKEFGCPVKEAEEIFSQTVEYENDTYRSFDRKIDRLLTGKFTAVPFMLILLGVVFWITITGANYPSKLLSDFLFSLEDNIWNTLSLMNIPEVVCDAVTFGIYRVVSWIVSVMLPPMAIFFPLFTFLEDLGYLPRIAFNMDKTFRRCCACGKQALTMCMGFGCNAVGVTGCRIIDSPRERLIAILTNSFVPCNGRFPLLITMITIFFAAGYAGSVILTLVVLIGIIMTFVISYILSKTFLKGEPSAFTLELPPYRRPQIISTIVRSIFDRTIFVLARALTVAAPAGLVIWLLANISIDGVSLLTILSSILDAPARIMGLDGVILLAFILGMPANEIVIPIMLMAYTASGTLIDIENTAALGQIFAQNGWTWVTAVNVMLFSLMHWPCTTTLMTIKKETGSIKWTTLAFILPTATGIIVCSLFTFVVGLIS